MSSDDIHALVQLKGRLVESFYRPSRRRPLGIRRPVMVLAAAGICGVAVALALVLIPGGVSPTPARAALERAASASQNSPVASPAAGLGHAWRARVALSWRYVLPLDPISHRAHAPAVLYQIQDTEITASGRGRQRLTTSTRLVGDRYGPTGRTLGQPSIQVRTTSPGQKLASPLLDTAPLLTYHQLRSLSADPASLRAVVKRLASTVGKRVIAPPTGRPSGAKRKSAPPAPTDQHTLTGSFTITTDGSCCGSPASTARPVAQLETVSALLAMPVTPQVRSGLYRLAARLPGVQWDGHTRDPIGRRGAEISVGPAGHDFRLVFDESTGALLSSTTQLGPQSQDSPVGSIVRTLTVATAG